MNYMEIMDLILTYGGDKQKLEMMRHEDPFNLAKYKDLEDHKEVVLYQICDEILKLTKKA